MSRGWRFLVDRGGTFTDVIGIAPDGARHVRKVLSADEGGDATVRAMREITGLDRPGEHVESLRLGTTIATNALLQRRVAPTLLAVTEGFADLLEIGTQQRPDLFALHVVKPSHVHDAVVEVRERVLHDGTVRRAPDAARVLEDLLAARRAGARSVAVALVHGSRHQAHERLVGALAREAGFEHVTLSCEAAPGPGLLERAQTAVVDAALTPLLREALSRLREELGPGPCLRVMTSSGAVVRAEDARGRDAVISGPAAGAVAVARAAAEAGASQALGFDMGGTSTDVSRWSAEDGIERAGSRAVAGVRIRADMLDVVTVAAGGGSVLSRLAGRFVVGPSSAGALPGPACYGRGGPPTVTDAQVVLGRLRPEWLPSCFGPGGDAPIDVAAARRALEPLARDAGLTLEEAADACVRVADDAMAQAIRQLSVARGRDPREHALVAFGGAGPQHACGLAASMGLGEVLVPALAGVFSAHGMGVADVARSRSEAVLLPLAAAAGRLAARLSALEYPAPEPAGP